MANDELLNYVRECLGRGLTREVIEGELLKVGWDRASVNDALNFVSGKRHRGIRSRMGAKVLEVLRPQLVFPRYVLGRCEADLVLSGLY